MCRVKWHHQVPRLFHRWWFGLASSTRTASWVRDRLYIGRLSERSKELVLAGKLPLAHAREISKVADDKRRDDLCKAYAAGGSDSISDVEAGQLADLQMEVRRSVFSLHVVPWQRHVAFAGRQPCEGCPHNSATNPGLFEGGGAVSLTMVGGRGTYDSESAGSEKVAKDAKKKKKKSATAQAGG